MLNWFATPFIILYAVLYGITMKIADLFNEHGLKEWFKGSRILFGFLWGIFGALLVISNVYVANVILAMILAFIVRMRIDYLNHAIATLIIIISFLFYGSFEPLIFFIFLVTFIIFGSIKDYLDDKLKSKGILQKIAEFGWYYLIPTLIYALFTSRWIVFYIFTIYIISYDVVKYIGEE